LYALLKNYIYNNKQEVGYPNNNFQQLLSFVVVML